MADSEVDRQSLFRQRRFLIAMTIVLVAIHSQAFDLGHEWPVSGLGLVLSIKSPLAVIFALSASWFWANARYMQYQRVFVSRALSERLQVETKRKVREFSNAYFMKQFREGKYKEKVGEPKETDVRFDFPTIIFVESIGCWQLNNVGISTIKQDEWHQAGVVADKYRLDAKTSMNIEKELRAHLFLNSPYFSDYRAPLLIALLAPFSGLIHLVTWLVC